MLSYKNVINDVATNTLWWFNIMATGIQYFEVQISYIATILDLSHVTVVNKIPGIVRGVCNNES